MTVRWRTMPFRQRVDVVGHRKRVATGQVVATQSRRSAPPALPAIAVPPRATIPSATARRWLAVPPSIDI